MRTLSTLCSLLFGVLAVLPHTARAADPLSDAPDQVIVPSVKPVDLHPPRFASSDFEVGLVAGEHGIRYYGFSRTVGLRLGYHINEDFFAELQLDQTDVSSKKLWVYNPAYNPSKPLDPVSNPKYTFQGDVPLKSKMLAMTYEGLFPGEVFVFDKYHFLTSGYVMGGLGKISFNGRDENAFRIGSGMRVYLTNDIVFRTEATTDFFTINKPAKKLHKIQRKGVYDGALTAGVSFLF